MAQPQAGSRSWPGRTKPDAVRRLLDHLAAEGEMIFVIGDAGRLTGHPSSGGFGCERHVTDMAREGAEIGLSVIACANSTNWAASGIRTKAAAVLIGPLRRRHAGRTFAEIAGLEAPGAPTCAHWWFYRPRRRRAARGHHHATPGRMVQRGLADMTEASAGAA